MQCRLVGKGTLPVILLLAMPCLAHGPLPTEWPVERMVANLEQRLSASPEDAALHYELGRTHAFAFALERQKLSTSLLGFTADPSKRGSRLTPPPSPEDSILHLRAAIQYLRRAVELSPRRGSCRLTLAWILETGSHLASRFDTVELLDLETTAAESKRRETRLRIEALCSTREDEAEAVLAKLEVPDSVVLATIVLGEHRVSPVASIQRRIDRLLARCWIEQSIQNYRQAFELALAVDVGNYGDKPFVYCPPRESASWEAGTSYLRLVRERGLLPEEGEIALEVQTKLEALEGMEVRKAITPLLLSLDACRSLDELVEPQWGVPFDLDGDEVDELWPWIAPQAGWLVWDPNQRGEITSGQQLFGSASAWLFFEDGYRVLDALDDDRDGELHGGELAGISVWFDRDTDGVSDRGEVVPVEELGIAALSTKATLRIGDSPANLCGVEMNDGRVLPTYDWVLAPVVP